MLRGSAFVGGFALAMAWRSMAGGARADASSEEQAAVRTKKKHACSVAG